MLSMRPIGCCRTVCIRLDSTLELFSSHKTSLIAPTSSVLLFYIVKHFGEDPRTPRHFLTKQNLAPKPFKPAPLSTPKPQNTSPCNLRVHWSTSQYNIKHSLAVWLVEIDKGGGTAALPGQPRSGEHTRCCRGGGGGGGGVGGGGGGGGIPEVSLPSLHVCCSGSFWRHIASVIINRLVNTVS